MGLKIVEGDVFSMEVDAVVKPTYRMDLIYQSLTAMDTFAMNHYEQNGADTKLTEAIIQPFNPDTLYRHKIYVCGPHFYKGKITQSIQLLKESYINVLMLATKFKLKSIAFSLISSGGKKFPKAIAFEVAKATLEMYDDIYPMDIYLMVYDKETAIYAEEDMMRMEDFLAEKNKTAQKKLTKVPDFEVLVKKPEKAFHEKLMELIRTYDIDEVVMYKEAFITKAHYHKLITGKSGPSRKTAMLLCVAMKLSLDDAKDLLKASGFTFNDLSHFDSIVEYHLIQGEYDLDVIDHRLFQFTQETLRKYTT